MVTVLLGSVLTLGMLTTRISSAAYEQSVDLSLADRQPRREPAVENSLFQDSTPLEKASASSFRLWYVRLSVHQLITDGPNKPAFKRNSKVGGSWGTNDRENVQFKQLLDLIGLERWDVSRSRGTV